METFQIEQTYDLAALTALCRAARKTTQKWKNVFRTICWIIFGLGVVIFVAELLWHGAPDFGLLALTALLLILLLLDDRLNAWVTLRRLVPGTAHSTTAFSGDVYTVTTDATETKYRYENITSLCETERYFLFFLGRRHGQIFDKQGFQSGEPEAFRRFIEEKTGKTFQNIK